LMEHEAIYIALVEGDAIRAQAAALMHVTTTETWLRSHRHNDALVPHPADPQQDD